jgi:hypothetical protein
MTKGHQEPDGAPSERPVTLSAIMPACHAGMAQGQAQAREPPNSGRPKAGSGCGFPVDAT